MISSCFLKQWMCFLSNTNIHLTVIFSFFPDDGKLHKAINVNDKMHIIEEIILFPEPQPVQHIELDAQRVNYNSVITSLMQNDCCQWLDQIILSDLSFYLFYNSIE